MATTNVWTQEQLETTKAFLQKLVGLGIEAFIKRIEPGPVVTGYYFELSNNVPLNKVMNKAEDFALAAHAEKVTIQRIGGEVVIFVSNRVREVIKFDNYMYWYCSDKKLNEMQLPVPLGVDTLGNYTAIDLVQQPHILLAGATGSGKSVFQSAVLCSMAVRKSPADLRVFLVDTKQLDLPLFHNLPHVQRVVKTLEQFHELMGFLLLQHESRKATIAAVGARNIMEYNKFMSNKGDYLRRKQLPYYMVIIDEFADLVEQDRAAKKAKTKDDDEGSVSKLPTVESWLQRLVQVSRATGIHIIAGTQRTSVKVINGDIKANFPCRISLRLPTEADSRTILGQGGAENLLGKGDMLVQFPDSEILKRFHGPFVELTDIARILDQNEFIRLHFQNVRGESII